jgi:hypothetical protein
MPSYGSINVLESLGCTFEELRADALKDID